MGTVALSNGKTLTLPDNATQEEAQGYYEQAEAAIQAESSKPASAYTKPEQPVPVDVGTEGSLPGEEAMNIWGRQHLPGLFGRQETAIAGRPGGPVPAGPPVEDDRPAWQRMATDTYHDWVPPDDVYAAPRTWGQGVVKGVYRDVPNMIPSGVNEIKALNDLWRGSGKGEVAPADQWQPWSYGTVPFTGGQTVDDLMPVKPGWEGVENTGRLTGVAIPAALAAVATGGAAVIPEAALGAGVGLPAVVKAGKTVGQEVDTLTGNENQKFERTFSDLAPLLTGAVRVGRGTPAVATAANAVNRFAVKPAMRGLGLYGIINHPLATAALAPPLAASKLATDLLTRPRGRLGSEFAKTLRETATSTARPR